MSTMIDRGEAIAAAIEVEKYSKEGTELLQSGQLIRAVKAFKYAYKFSGKLDDEYMERACAFNLGAAYIAMGQGEKGLNVLQSAVPSDDRKDGRSNGDLYFNFGLGYENVRNVPEAIRSFNKALEEYRMERDNISMEIETLLKLSTLYTQTRNNHLMNTYHQLAEAYAMQENIEKQMWALCEKANSYNRFGDAQQAGAAADQCYKLSEKCDNTAESGNIFNDLGLLYTQLQKYEMAKKCFEEALPLAQMGEDRKREAVIRQNLGAAYNFLGEYQRAISFHKSAADMYARLQNRNSQGQCYANLAYAYSQIGDGQRAKEAFKHSLLAAEDTDDNRTTWQVSEGLGSVAFSEGNFDESIDFFKKALGVLAAKESNVTAQNRIVEKLKQALEAQIKGQERQRPFSLITKEDVSPLKAGFKKPAFLEKASMPSDQKPVTEEVTMVTGASVVTKGPDDEIRKRFVQVSKHGSTKRFSKVARGLSDLMEPYHPSPRDSLQGETLKPVQSESSESESESGSQSTNETESESEREEKKFAPAISKVELAPPEDIKNSPSNVSLHGSLASDEETGSSSSGESEGDYEDQKAVREQMRKYKSDSEEEDKDRGNEKSGQQRQAKTEGKKEEESSESESSGSETGSSESESSDEAPPVPSGSLPKTGQINTYEQPQFNRQSSKKKINYADLDFDPSPKRGESFKSHPNYLTDTDSLRVNMGTRASGKYDNNEELGEDDPLYQSITPRTLSAGTEHAKTPPNFPDFSSLPRGEKERIMFSKHKQDMERNQAPPLPERGEKDSKTCSVM